MSELDPKVVPVNRGDGKTPDFAYLWATCRIDKAREREVMNQVARIANNYDVYAHIGRLVDCAWWVPGLVHYRESSRLTLDVYLHNGQRLGKPTTIVPKGILFRADQFVEAAVDALNRQGLKGIKDPVAFLPKAERFNGLGYRKRVGDRGVIEYSPYVWAATNHHDETSKFVSDGRYDKFAKEKQLGVAALLKGILS